MTYNAQQLRHRIAFERLQEVIDPETGYRTEEWVTVAEAFARMDPMVGRERLLSEAIRSEEVTKFTTRWLDGIKPADRLVHRGEFWNIQSIVDVGGLGRETLVYAIRT